MEPVRSYGVKEQVTAPDAAGQAVETIATLGYAVVDSGWSASRLDEFAACFDRALSRNHAEHGGRDTLAAIDEHHTIRALLAHDDAFLKLARSPIILDICERMLGNMVVLNQQNGIVNPPHGERYNQGAFHRDLPYQHFVSSRPLALNALFCMDEFTLDNGATLVLPATHKQEAFPSEEMVRRHAIPIAAPRGSFIVLDCMVYHSGGVNRTGRERRAVNHVYAIPPLRQQFDLPALLGSRFADDPVLGPFLGYGLAGPASMADYYASRRRRTGLAPA